MLSALLLCWRRMASTRRAALALCRKTLCDEARTLALSCRPTLQQLRPATLFTAAVG